MEQLRTGPLPVHPRDLATGHPVEATRDWALFLDADGTLLHIVEAPSGAEVNGHLRGGMNLAAKKYIAAQWPEDPGILVLSRFARAAQELNGALIVNPYDTSGVAGALETALTMHKREHRERWETMCRRLCQFDVTAWREAYISALSAASRAA
jgi:trehalose-6-phosphate synthase